MRIAIAGISHETNTYCHGFTTVSDFHVQRAPAMRAASGQETDVGGAMAACQRLKVTAVPLMFAQAQPSGTVERATFEMFADEIIEGIAAAGADAVVLLLHGAGVADGLPDIEGELASRVRGLVGNEVPVVATFDLHGNISQRMCDNLNGVFACHQYPHIDMHIQAEVAVEFALMLATTKRKARCSMVSVPLLLPTTTTFEGVGEAMLGEVLGREGQSACVDISWFHGFPYTDIEHVGSSVVVTWLEDEMTEKAAKELAHSVGQALWEQREVFRPISLSAAEAVDAAIAQVPQDAQAPVVIHETSDNCGAGTPGDGTHLLRAMLDAKLATLLPRGACFGFVVDAITAAQAHAAGVGAEIAIELGARTDDLHGTPVIAQARVRALHDGQLILQHMFRGAPLKLGPLARLEIDGLDVVVGSRRSQTFDKEPFLAVGIDVMRYDVVALKSSNHFRGCFQKIAESIVTADPPGLSTHNIGVFPRQATSRAFWPVNDRAKYPD